MYLTESPELAALRKLSDRELERRLADVQNSIETARYDEDAIGLTVERDWIAQARRLL